LTTEDHNKLLGILHLIQGGMGVLTLFILLPFFLIFVVAAGQEGGGLAFMVSIIGLLILIFSLMLVLPPLIAGYGMLKRKSWARVWGIIAAVVSSFSFPFGTALCVYSLWFLFGEGKAFHDSLGRPGAYNQGRPGALGEGRPFGWDARTQASWRPHEYTPPPQPPDWRGDS
jgi:hypothetical protein